jgi:alpha-amylase/alpha-mannosidase (GH57 family)
MVARTSRDSLPVLFLWHHHQPFYQGPEMSRPVMPWVRLHAVRGYWDMITAAKEAEAAVTFNFSPSLLEQLQFAAGHQPADEFEHVSLIPAGDLTEHDKLFMLTNFFSINWNLYVRTQPRYQALLAKRGEEKSPAKIKQALIDFTLQDYTDLSALFNLSWIGFTGRRDRKIAELFKKQKNYRQADIESILNIHHRIVEKVIPEYALLQQQGLIEISTSPYSHAILPLLCDSLAAAPDIPRQQLPRPGYQHPEDAALQLRLAASTYQEIWGQSHRGLWPSEGSLSDEAMLLAAQEGFHWAATDQGNLEKSERSRKDNLAHFVSHQWKRGENRIRLYFRDRALSDAIGFRYAAMSTHDAVAEFVGHLRRIEEGTRGIGGRCVVVALDGENPWESYPDSGEAFLSHLYQTIAKDSHLTLDTFANHVKQGTREEIQHLHSGSWIDSNFRIWIGDPEKNQAWMELGRAKRLLDELPVGDERRDKCRHWLLRAQGSDWFWWYGEPFNSDFEDHFDELFRSFLTAVYAAAGKQPPPSLAVPIAVPVKVERRLQPAFPIAPVIDGRETTFFEWIGACRIDPRQYGSVMGRSEHLLRSLYYGFGGNDLFFRFDPVQTLYSKSSCRIILYVCGQSEITLSFSLYDASATGDLQSVFWAAKQVVEVMVPGHIVGVVPGGECQFWLEIADDGATLEKLPPAGAYHFSIPTAESLAANWII